MEKDVSLWGNLAGPPTRVSGAVSTNSGRRFPGWIKLRLCHGEGKSYFLPDVLIGFDGKKFFLPSFFGPPQLSFHVPNNPPSILSHHRATFSMDVAAPRGTRAVRLFVHISSNELVRCYNDGAQLYRCTFQGPENTPLAPLIAGNSLRLPNDDFALEVYHHTKPETIDLIRSSEELWSGLWNLAGTRKLENVACTYFTTLPDIKDEADLHRIAMSTEGKISYQTTSDRDREEPLHLEVYSGTTVDRTASVAFLVPSEIIAPAHLLFHTFIPPNPAYFEVVGPEIVRVTVEPNSCLKFDGNEILTNSVTVKRFSYVVEGDASTKTGLEAPMKEEETTQIAHIEKLDEGLDIFEFWIGNQNTDQFSKRDFESRRLNPNPED
ncbi:MAG: hypothetical protein GY742_09980 [Hyphomicrobiales bacterium]|nr:hypothetical protein [Hyphomicrobiales bacterium]